MQLTFIPHPDAQPAEPGYDLWANVEMSAVFGQSATLNVWFGVTAPAERFVIPATAEPVRADQLWRTTCFEIFLGEANTKGYREWNFSPSSEWAAYDFANYRAAMTDATVGASPNIRVEDNLTWWMLGATIAVDSAREWVVGMSAVLEEKDGTKSYWALAHAPGPPDFHNRDCFVARLP